MLAVLLLFAAQGLSAEPIVIRSGTPARNQRVSATYDCGSVAFDLHYSATRQGVNGSLVARNGDEIIEATAIQSDLFSNLSSVGSTTVICDPDDRAHVLVAGVEKQSGIVDRLWKINFAPEEGFGSPIDISD